MVEHTVYVVIPEKRDVGYVNRSNFVTLGAAVFSREVSPAMAPLFKLEIVPDVRFGEREIEFTGHHGIRIRLPR